MKKNRQIKQNIFNNNSAKLESYIALSKTQAPLRTLTGTLQNSVL